MWDQSVGLFARKAWGQVLNCEPNQLPCLTRVWNPLPPVSARASLPRPAAAQTWRWAALPLLFVDGIPTGAVS